MSLQWIASPHQMTDELNQERQAKGTLFTKGSLNVILREEKILGEHFTQIQTTFAHSKIDTGKRTDKN